MKPEQLKIPEIVHQGPNGKWYFWQETWADKSGPFSTEEEAQFELEKYCKEFLGYEE